jgi:hypothetical protein
MKSKRQYNPLILSLVALVVFVQFALNAHNCLDFSRLSPSHHDSIQRTSSSAPSRPHSDCEFCRLAQSRHSTAAVQASSFVSISAAIMMLMPDKAMAFTPSVLDHTTRGPPSLNL